MYCYFPVHQRRLTCSRSYNQSGSEFKSSFFLVLSQIMTVATVATVVFTCYCKYLDAHCVNTYIMGKPPEGLCQTGKCLH